MSFSEHNFSPFSLTQYNNPFSDTHLLISHSQLRDVLLFDIGNITDIPLKTLLKVRYVFVSHNHMDHFCGFSYFLRNILRLKNRTITLFGTKDFIQKIAYNIHSFEWNLLDNSAPLFEIYEIQTDAIYYLPPTPFYQIDPQNPYKTALKRPFETQILKTDDFYVEIIVLDHKIPVLGFKFTSSSFLKIDESKIISYKKGPWISKAQKMIQNHEDLEILLEIDETTSLPLHKVKDFFQTIVPYQFCYLTDFSYNQKDIDNLTSFIKKSDLIFIESHFLKQDERLAKNTYHLTTYDVAQIIKQSEIKNFVLTHFSQRYLKSNTAKDFYEEVKEYSL